MAIKIQKWGNSQGIRLPKSLLIESGLRTGDALDCKVERGRITLTPAKGKGRRSRYRLGDLLSQMPERKECRELDWGEDVGGERF